MDDNLLNALEFHCKDSRQSVQPILPPVSLREFDQQLENQDDYLNRKTSWRYVSSSQGPIKTCEIPNDVSPPSELSSYTSQQVSSSCMPNQEGFSLPMSTSPDYQHKVFISHRHNPSSSSSDTVIMHSEESPDTEKSLFEIKLPKVTSLVRSQRIFIGKSLLSHPCLHVGLISSFVILTVCVLVTTFHAYIKSLLLWMEKLDLFTAGVLLIILFTVISFPLMWGYVLLNLAAGYLYGTVIGTCIVATGALIGVALSHVFMKNFCSDCVYKIIIVNERFNYILKVLESDKGFKVMLLARLTPIPFGLQNGLFAISRINFLHCLLATVIGLFPTQLLNAYIGSSLRSMEELFSDGSHRLTGWCIFITQLVMTVLLMVYVAQRANGELSRDVGERQLNPPHGSMKKLLIT